LSELTERIDKVLTYVREPYAFETVPIGVVEMVLGAVEESAVTLTEVEKVFFDEIAPPEIVCKSPGQKRRWVIDRKYTFDLLRRVIGDKPITDIDRSDALKFYRHLMSKVTSKDGAPTHSLNYGHKQICRVRRLYGDYFKHIGDLDHANPFAALAFRDNNRKSRPAFTPDWIKDTILRRDALAGINDQARGILLVIVDTGARLGEICNLTKERIHLDDPIPYIEIAPQFDPDNPREIKTKSSIRKIPLIGMALAALQQHPNGFPRYQDKENSLSATLNKFFRENGLFPSEKHTIYSFRHSFEDRMKEAGIDHELRCRLMGHSIDRPEYGTGGSLKWQHGELRKIEIPFNPTIV